MESLPAATRMHRIDTVMGHGSSVVERMEQEGLVTSHLWRDHFLHQVVTIDPDRCERSFTLRLLHTAVRSGAQSWTLLTEASGSLEAQAIDGFSHLERVVDLDDGLTALQFTLDHPVEKGQGSMIAVRLDHHNSTQSTFIGYGLRRGMDCLVFEVRFEGDKPGGFRHLLRDPGAEDFRDQGSQPVHSPQGVQYVIRDPAAGLHHVEWDWEPGQASSLPSCDRCEKPFHQEQAKE